MADCDADATLAAVTGRHDVSPGSDLMEVRQVSKAFAGLHALDDVSFGVRAGEILGVIGPNGAGKTTLFNVLNGFLAPDHGDVRYRGASIAALRPSAICRRGSAARSRSCAPSRTSPCWRT